jgi:hypothetical protein
VTTDDVAARYARPARPARRRRGRRVLLVLAAAVAVAVGSAAAWTVAAGLSGGVRWQDVSFAVVDERTVRTTFEVYADPGDRVRCQVRAADARYNDVGQVDVDLGPLASRGTSTTVEVRTTGEAVTSSVRRCVLVP